MKSFYIRAISAAVAVAGLIALAIFMKETGFILLCYLIVILGAHEALKILFHDESSKLAKTVFYLCTIINFSIAVYFPFLSTIGFAFLSLVFCSVAIFIRGKFDDLSSLTIYQAKGVLGFFYVGLLPALGCRLLFLPNGMVWFFTMLGIVFAGDTFAYLSGMFFGKTKLMPTISPKKTVEGSLGGLVGSMIAAVIASFFLPHVNLLALLPLALVVGVFAQIGDLFESLLKRVANLKDSGSLMPGHGGVLDRIDGVLFATPLMLLGASFIERWY